MGLLKLDDPQQLGLLSLGLRLLSTPGNFGEAVGRAGLGSIGDMQQAQTMADQRRVRALQEQQAQMQLEAAQKAQERAAGIEGAYRNAFRTPDQQAMAQHGGPTVAAAQAAPTMQPKIDQDALLKSLVEVDPMSAYQMMQPKPADYKVVGGSLVEVGPRGVREAYRAPTESKPTTDIQNYEFAKAQGYGGSFTDWKRDNARAGASTTSIKVGADGKSVPPAVVKQQDDLIDRMVIARSTDADLGALEQKIASGALSFGPVANPLNTARNAVGMSNEQSRNFASFKSNLEKLRNDSLRLNAGVQTEGDAQRAWNELFQSINDTDLVKSRLAEIRKINQRAAQLQQYRLDVLRQNFGAGALPDAPVAPAIEVAPAAQRRFNPATGKIE